MKRLQEILIAGGGTAGWLTAAYLAKVYGNGAGCPRITLVESPDIGTIGVGEGTFPTLRITLQTLGIDESEFMREADATFKQGVKFIDWLHTPKDGQHSYYLHPFDAPYPTEGAGLMPYWLLQDPKTRLPYAEAVAFQCAAAHKHRAPKTLADGSYGHRLNYAYHFDAARFAALLTRRAKDLGVRHLQGRIEDVRLHSDGAIASVTTAEHGELEADFFVDCTGFRARLIGDALKAPFVSVGRHLLTDRAVALQAPYATPDAPIPSFTLSTAHEAGWTWDIGLGNRRGIGYVYSSQHSSDERAVEVLKNYIGAAARDLEPRVIRFKAGYRTTPWVKNCVAIGLSGSFFEPLEATGILLIEVAISYLVDFLPRSGPIDAAARQFNALMDARCQSVLNFLKLHYCLSQREEPFWRDNADPASLPDHLAELLEMWKHRPPSRFDINSEIDPFPLGSYQYILYGLGYPTDIEAQRPSFPQVEAAERAFERVKNFGAYAARDLPDNRALIERLRAHGFASAS
ncbi:tryptophan 7-halogenase [Asticcacaulis sp. EMRT-3]|uniref:tryptophan halogenase family protein n=1 Tax=Asticcacaulis sp. EMRT-3 TaxID=3040349 RepID=UPI0024AF3AA3|nr:tryptophan 7-halogenase [Asticcacaulis sp. EMRT-3]MDI7775566.1 tryptophan 7-halogenase [Asticcacaulis sp. EMRT-3]